MHLMYTCVDILIYEEGSHPRVVTTAGGVGRAVRAPHGEPQQRLRRPAEADVVQVERQLEDRDLRGLPREGRAWHPHATRLMVCCKVLGWLPGYAACGQG